MFSNHGGKSRALVVMAALLLETSISFAGVSRAIQDRYRSTYENKALFLKIPVFVEKHYVSIAGRSFRSEQGATSGPARFKVGDQVRILGIDFGGEEIKFRLAGIATNVTAEIVFKFDSSLAEEFPNKDIFDSALQATFTEGLKYTDLEDAKRGYVEDAFDRAVREIATTTGTTREAVLKNMASRLPAYQEALKELDNLKSRNQEVTAQLAQVQSENRRFESEIRQQQSELSRLRTLSAALQEKIDNSSSQLARLGDDLRTARGLTQGAQNQLTTLQRSLNLKIDPSRDLVSQINELGQAIKKLQKDGENLEAQNSSLRSTLENQQAINSRLSGEIEDLKTAGRQMRETIDTLSSKEDSLARQYLQLKKAKENIENVALSVQNLSTRTVDDKSEGGIRRRKVNVYIRNMLLGTVEWRLPERLSHNEANNADVRFSTESVDYVRVTPEERHILRSLGERFKVGVKLTSPSSMEVNSESGDSLQELGERDQASWRWKIRNRGTQDARLALAIHLVNKNSDEIPLLRDEHLVLSSSVVRQVRNYLQPVPLLLGALVGFLLFGIVGIFRKGKKSRAVTKPAPITPSEPPSYIGQKQL